MPRHTDESGEGHSFLPNLLTAKLKRAPKEPNGPKLAKTRNYRRCLQYRQNSLTIKAFTHHKRPLNRKFLMIF